VGRKVHFSVPGGRTPEGQNSGRALKGNRAGTLGQMVAHPAGELWRSRGNLGGYIQNRDTRQYWGVRGRGACRFQGPGKLGLKPH